MTPGSPRVDVNELRVSVWRGGADGRYQQFAVPRRASQTVLDVVTYIQRRLDATLAYRFACRVGMCGSCAMTVNGAPRWTCRTHVDRVARDGALEIAPLANMPVVRDLVADMREFFDKWARARGQFTPTRTRGDDFAVMQTDEDQRRPQRNVDCELGPVVERSRRHLRHGFQCGLEASSCGSSRHGDLPRAGSSF